MNGQHAARLAELTRVLDAIGGTPPQARAALLAPNDRGQSLFQRLVTTSRPTVDRPEGFRPEDLLGAHRTGDVTVLGELLDDELLDWPSQRA